MEPPFFCPLRRPVNFSQEIICYHGDAEKFPARHAHRMAKLFEFRPADRAIAPITRRRSPFKSIAGHKIAQIAWRYSLRRRDRRDGRECVRVGVCASWKIADAR